MLKLAVTGCYGRMGKRITQLALEDSVFKVVCLLEQVDRCRQADDIGGVSVSSDIGAVKDADVLIDFTTPEATMENVAKCVEHSVKMVIGTTGLDAEQQQRIKDASEKIAIVFSSNMSVGVNILFKLTQIAAGKTAGVYNIRIEEAHHVHKKDAPSGTAKTLAKIAEDASLSKVGDIKSIREGEIIGDHTITFESEEDIIILSHHAKTRDIFAKGALVAAKFVFEKDKGLYDMQDVLGLS